MKVFKTNSGILIDHRDSFFLLEDANWDTFINDDELYDNTERIISSDHSIDTGFGNELIVKELNAPVGSQEIWASGVTYFNSKLGREEESKESGGSDFYGKVYDADRPELFFKATKNRTVGSGDFVRIRGDSDWNVPEPELTLVITSNGKIVGYTIGNDMSSRSIEGENPLYLPQAKTYDGSAAVGPCVYVTKNPLPPKTKIEMEILRSGSIIFKDEIEISQIKREFSELVSYLYRECSFPHGSLLMTGTGIVPTKDFTLQRNDEIRISINPIGILKNKVN